MPRIIYADNDGKYAVGIHFCQTQRIYDNLRVKIWGWKRPSKDEDGVSAGCFQGTWISKKARISSGERLVGGIAINLCVLPTKFDVHATIAHECVHAAAHYMKQLGEWKEIGHPGWRTLGKAASYKDPEKIGEERLAYAVGRLTANAISLFNKR